MALDPQILQSSFDLVLEREPQMTKRFYQIFFSRYPQVRPMFGTDQSRQAEMLQGAIAAVLERLEDAPWLTSTLGAMGRKHIDYGVEDHMYAWVGECLLAALAEIAGDAWTPAVAAQWTEAYGAIAGMMQTGAQEARAEASAAARA